ncbi:Gfo/Idh/MocA family protein [Microbacterium lacticum]
MHGWGMVGTGDISGQFAPDLQAATGGGLRGVWGRTQEKAERFAALHGVPFATASRDDLLGRDEIDIVYIATPAVTHLAIALEALEAGKHVLVEKPMAMSAVEVEQLFTKAREVGRFAMEAMWMRFNPLHAGLRDRIFDGLLGEVTSVRAGFGTPFHARGDKVVPADGGSILLDRGIYPVTLAHWFLGEPLAIRASGTLQNGVDIAGHAMLEYPEGRFAQLAWSGVEFLELSASVSGERGWVVLDPMFWAGSTARVHAGTYERIFRTPEIVDHPREGNGFRPMIRAVVEALDAGLLEHPWQRRDDTLAVARTMDRVLHEIQ